MNKAQTLADVIREIEDSDGPWTVRLEFKLRSPLPHHLLRANVDGALTDAARKIIAVAGWAESDISTSVSKEPKTCRD